MSMNRVLIVIMVLFWFLTSCKKEDTSIAGQRLLQRVVSRGGDTIGYVSFQYDTLMRLTKITDSNNNDKCTGETSIMYDTVGNPVKFSTNRYCDYCQSYSAIYVLKYFNGRVIEKLSKNDNNGLYKTIHVYSYDTKGRLIKDSMSYFTNQVTLLKYDDNDNVTELKTFIDFQKNQTINYSYNPERNPYSRLGLILYFMLDYPSNYLSKNAVNQKVFDTRNFPITTAKLTCEYEDNLIKTITTKFDSDLSFLIKDEFYYY